MQKTITTQKELDEIIEIKKGEEICISSSLILKHVLKVYGKLIIEKPLACDWYVGYVQAYGNSTVQAYENSTVKAWGNSTVKAWGNSTVKADENSTVQAYGNSTVQAYGNSTVQACGNSTVQAWENSTVQACGNSNVQAWENSTVQACGNSNVKAYGNANVTIFSLNSKTELYGFSSFHKLVENNNIKNNSKFKTGIIPKIKPGILGWLENNGIEDDESIIIYKRVSKDFKTQENTKNETLWEIGKEIEHKNWNPTQEECGEGKFHGCSRAYFCDQFMDEKDDKYIAIKVDKKDLYVWENARFPHKIAFRKGKILFQCDKMGNELKQ